MNHMTNLYIMFFIMLLSGFLATMNVWANSINDIRFSLNDVYMVLLMTGWMFSFMGVFYRDYSSFLLGVILVCFNVWCIRTQFMVSQQQFLQGMIPHHSMAIHMSKKVLENTDTTKNRNFKTFVENIIKTQADEIQRMKKML